MMVPSPLLDTDCIVFDMDGTLAVSKGTITPSMAELLNRLLEKKTVAVISGGMWEQFEKQLIPYLSKERLEHLMILPTSGTALYTYKNGIWHEEYREVISTNERTRIIQTLRAVLTRVGYHEEETIGPTIEDRESQITFSGLGSQAPFEKKQYWDPDQKKRALIASILRERLPEYTITIGGTTSIDITPKGVDKAYGINALVRVKGIPLERIVFIGDKLSPGGNDFPVVKTGVRTISVVDEHETEQLLASWNI